MTAQLPSRERLEALASGNAFTCVQDDEAAAMARMLLAGMDSKPAAVTDKWPDCSSAGFGTYDGCIAVVTPSGKIADIDACLVSEVVGLWQQGITTIESCCGHGKASSYIAVIPDDDTRMLNLGYIPSTESGAPHVFYSKTSRHGVNDRSLVAVPVECPRSVIEDAESFDSAEDMARSIWNAIRATMLKEDK